MPRTKQDRQETQIRSGKQAIKKERNKQEIRLTGSETSCCSETICLVEFIYQTETKWINVTSERNETSSYWFEECPSIQQVGLDHEETQICGQGRAPSKVKGETGLKEETQSRAFN